MQLVSRVRLGSAVDGALVTLQGAWLREGHAAVVAVEGAYIYVSQVVDNEAGALGEDTITSHVLAYEVGLWTFLVANVFQLDSFIGTSRHRFEASQIVAVVELVGGCLSILRHPLLHWLSGYAITWIDSGISRHITTGPLDDFGSVVFDDLVVNNIAIHQSFCGPIRQLLLLHRVKNLPEFIIWEDVEHSFVLYFEIWVFVAVGGDRGPALVLEEEGRFFVAISPRR